MIKAIIIEDEPKNVNLLKKMIELYCSEVSICGQAGTIDTAFELIKKSEPDLVFLDIEISGDTAFELLDQLQPVKFEVIFVTAFDNYVLKAIKYSALDYLLKPISIDELVAAVNKSISKLHAQKITERIDTLLENLSSPKKAIKTIALPTNFGFEFIPVQNIVRCEAKNSYTIISLNHGKNYTSSKNLKEFEDILPTDIFFRAHHAHLININFVKKYHRGTGGYLEMTDKAHIPLAARRKNEFLNIFSAAS